MLKSNAQSAPCPSPITRLILFIVKSAESLYCQKLVVTLNQLTTLIESDSEHLSLVPIGFPVCLVKPSASCVVKSF